MPSSAVSVLKRYYEEFNGGDMQVFLGLLTEDVVHDINQGHREVGREAFREFMLRMNRCYRESIHDLVLFSEPRGQFAASEYVVEGEYLQTDAGLPPATGQKYRIAGGAFFELRDGQIARVTNYYNLAEWLRQIGA